MPASATQRTVEAVWRIESSRLIAGLSRVVRDIPLAEDLAQDALVVALETWPRTGVPDNPGAWLMAIAKHRAIDTLRRGATLDRKREQIARELETAAEPDLDAALDDDIGDDLLRMVFTACHPVLPTDGRIALTLRLLGGLTTSEIARAFLVPETTLAQRITRAKRTLAEAGVPFEAPSGDERVGRLGSVLEVVYLIFNEGYAATAGDDWMRVELCEDALRLGRILARILPGEAEVHGLVALMEIQQSRARARVGPEGEPVLLADQDRARWDRLLITRGLAGLARAVELGDLGPYALQAAIAACHARARHDRGHRLGADRAALRRAGRGRAVTGGGAQPRRRRLDGRRAGGRPGGARRARRRARAAGLPPAAGRARRHARAARAPGGGARGVHARGRADAQRARARAAARADTRTHPRAMML